MSLEGILSQARYQNILWTQGDVPKTDEYIYAWIINWRNASLTVIFLSFSFFSYSLFLSLLLNLGTKQQHQLLCPIFDIKVLDGGDYPPAPSTPPEPAPPDPRDPRSNPDRRLMQLESVAGFRRLMKASTMPAATSGSHTSLEDITCKRVFYLDTHPISVLKNFSWKLFLDERNLSLFIHL